MKTKFTWVVSVLGLVPMLGCGADDYYGGDDGWDDGGTTWECYSANDCEPGQYCNEFHYCVWPDTPPADADADADTDDDWLPPEVEYEFGPPASGFRYVYVALQNLDTVARVDSESLDVVTVPVGDRPDQLVTVQGQDVAVLLNRGSDSVSILRTVDGEDEVVTLSTPPLMNRLVVSPGGSTALAYFELDDPRADEVGSFQDMAVIDLTEGDERVVHVSVGFRPRNVVFTADERVALVITEDGISIIDLREADEGFVARTVPVSLDPLTEGDPAEVVISSDGSHAFARWDGLAAVRAVDLEAGSLVDTPLPGVPTDIDLTSDGALLIAAVRDTSQVAIMDVPDGIGDVDALRIIDCAPLVVGSAVLTPDDGQIVAFTNATTQEAVVLIDLETGDTRIALLRKGVRAVAMSPDGRTALVLHNRTPGEPSPTDDFEEQVDKRPGFSLLELDTLFVKLQLTEAEPGPFTFFPDSTSAYVIVADRSESLMQVARIDLESFLVGTIDVGSPPVEIGNVPGTDRVYVSQDHPMGRLSFIDVRSGESRTVTGFELNSQIVE
jgi:dipeptidyl aminopeptidase/acylaminoacyl peptidase